MSACRQDEALAIDGYPDIKRVRDTKGIGRAHSRALQGIGADDWSAAPAAPVRPTVRIIGDCPQGRSHEAVGGIGLRRGRGRVRTMRTVAP
jgi:hypothetical protein